MKLPCSSCISINCIFAPLFLVFFPDLGTVSESKTLSKTSNKYLLNVCWDFKLDLFCCRHCERCFSRSDHLALHMKRHPSQWHGATSGETTNQRVPAPPQVLQSQFTGLQTLQEEMTYHATATITSTEATAATTSSSCSMNATTTFSE